MVAWELIRYHQFRLTGPAICTERSKAVAAEIALSATEAAEECLSSFQGPTTSMLSITTTMVGSTVEILKVASRQEQAIRYMGQLASASGPFICFRIP